MKGVALKLSCIETPQCLNSGHRPVLMRVEEEVRQRVLFPPKDVLYLITQDEVSKHIKVLKIRKTSDLIILAHNNPFDLLNMFQMVLKPKERQWRFLM
ncbi:hypothetical protein EVAR_92998_1 [Eumeta japonica]|uniref:Uncharacterized protein n=1 Tax=Eumeta variegata TaxID=151549 RepID=A0A4C1TDN8_EUMVA|nr:hypothetical protein EVAR_92998_1 [Eumeta japonica]